MWLRMWKYSEKAKSPYWYQRRRFLLTLYVAAAKNFPEGVAAFGGDAPPSIVVIGGGASGIFAAIHAAEKTEAQVTVLEATRKTLHKVKISGGGRCNVLHDVSKPPSELLQGYPRGSKELRGILHKHFSPTQAAAWFTEHGVALKTESDGRMFPTTDSSQTIMDALLSAAAEARVAIRTQCKVLEINSNDGPPFRITFQQESESQQCFADAVIVATGSSPWGYKLIRDQLEQPFVDTVPSLFTLNTAEDVVEGGTLQGLAGISVDPAQISFRNPRKIPAEAGGKKKRKKKLQSLSQEGPLLITHQGFSGPAALRLSAFGAREFAESRYQGELVVNWVPNEDTKQQPLEDTLWDFTQDSTLASTKVAQFCPLPETDIPKRLWIALVHRAIPDSATMSPRWADLSKAKIRSLAQTLEKCTFQLTGKGTFKEEFVTAGGVSLAGVDMKTMQCKSTPGLFVCGELINVDGVTGGYNFMNCWGTGYVAGTSAAEHVSCASEEITEV